MPAYKTIFKKLISVMLIPVLTLTVTACGTKYSEEVQMLPKEIREYTDILSNPWTISKDEPTELSGWEVVQYVPVEESESFGYFKSTAYTDKYFYTEQYYETMHSLDAVDREIEILRIDLDTMAGTRTYLKFSDFDWTRNGDTPTAEELDERVQKGNEVPACIDAEGDKLILFLIESRVKEEGRGFYKIVLSLDDKTAEISDCTEAVDKLLNIEREYFSIPFAVCGPDGSLCYMDKEERVMKVYDKTGKEIASFDVSALTEYVGKSADGVPIFYEQKGLKEAEFFGVDEGGRRLLFKGEMTADKSAVDCFGNVLMMQGGKLLSWNVKSGEVKSIYRFEGLNISSCQGIMRNGAGEIITCCDEGEGAFFFRLNDDEHPDTVEIKILVRFQDQFIERCASDYERSHPGIKVTLERIESNDELEWAKLAVAIKEGEGPDVILSDRRQLSILKNAGTLCPIDSMLADEVKENVFKCVLKYGEFDGCQYAVSTSAALRMQFAKDDVLRAGSYSLEELMTAYDEYKRAQNGKTIFEYFGYEPPTWMIGGVLCTLGIEHTDFLDMNEYTCNFDSEEFCRVLRFCRENGNDGGESAKSYSSEEAYRKLYSGEIFLWSFSGNLGDYSGIMKQFGTGFHTVDYPYGDGVTAFAECSDALAVSDFSNHKEIAADFINYCFGEKCQVYYATNRWVRKDILRSHVKDAHERIVNTINGPDYAEEPAFVVNAGCTNPLAGKPDGTSYLEEFIAIMDAAVPETVLNDITDIINEESQSYFSGMKTEREAATVIQSRVKIYLEERKP